MTESETDERELRVQLAAGYRLAHKYGMSEIINTHISLRVPGDSPTFLFNPHGMLFDEITASSLVRVDLAGNLVEPIEWPVNAAGVAIHGAILEARPDVNCVFHTHTPYTVAVSSLACGLLPMTQAALGFNGTMAYHEYGRAATDPVERSRLAEDMGNKSAMLLRNHGAITTGKTVGEAFIHAYYLELACQFQVIAQSSGQPIHMPAEEHQNAPARMTSGQQRAWPGLLRSLDRLDPSYKD